MTKPEPKMIFERSPLSRLGVRLKLRDGELAPDILGEVHNLEDARRIAASYNACAGLPVELLESVGQVVVEGCIPYRLMAIQHAVLLDTLKKATHMLERDYIDDDKMKVIAKCFEAIELCEPPEAEDGEVPA